MPTEQRERVKKSLGLEGFLIGYVGRLSRAKGLHILTAALERLPGSVPWSLLLLGSGPYGEEMKAWARSRGWEKRLKIMLVKHEDVPNYFPAMDLKLLPSQTTWRWREQFGRVIVEAFASGVPVIGSDSGEIPRVIGDAGLVVGEKDVAGWAEGIERLYRDESMRETFRIRALNRVEKYSAVTVAGQYAEFYRWLAEQPVR